MRSIKETLAGFVTNQDIAGGSIVIRKCGKIICKEWAGYADTAAGIPISDETIYRLASMTKPVTAVAAMCLVEQGKLSLSDPISLYFPAFSKVKVATEQIPFEMVMGRNRDALEEMLRDMRYEPLAREITIQDILTHQSGIGHGIVSMMNGRSQVTSGITLEQRIKQISELPLDFQPGTATGYSATFAFDVLGGILEKVTDMNLAEVFQKHIFKPLGMCDTTFTPREDQKTRVQKLYLRRDSELIDAAPAGSTEVFNPLGPAYYSGSAGLYGTLTDYDKFAQMLYQRGTYNGVQILKESTIQQMATSDGISPRDNEPGAAWGLGMLVFRPESGRPLGNGTFGWSGAYGSHFYIDWERDLSMVFMTNRLDIGGANSYVSLELEKVIAELYGTN